MAVVSVVFESVFLVLLLLIRFDWISIVNILTCISCLVCASVVSCCQQTKNAFSTYCISSILGFVVQLFVQIILIWYLIDLERVCEAAAIYADSTPEKEDDVVVDRKCDFVRTLLWIILLLGFGVMCIRALSVKLA